MTLLGLWEAQRGRQLGTTGQDKLEEEDHDVGKVE
jgi:hypothetical protein